MAAVTTEGLEGRINALREVLLLVVRSLPEADMRALLAEAAELAEHPNHQEDPGAMPSSAFAMQVARTKELEALVRDITSG